MADGPEFWSAGWAALQAGQPTETERFGRAALAADRSSVEGWFLLGLACQAQGRHDEAADCYRYVTMLRPDLPEAHNNLGVTLRDLGQLGEAVESYRRALALCPGLPETHNNLGLVLLDLGRSEAAAAHFREAVNLRPDYSEAHNNLGIALVGLGQPAAAECFRHALDLRPDYPDAHNNLGAVLRALGRFEEAEGYYRQALSLRPDYPEAYNNLGAVLQDLGRPADAVTSYARALALWPSYAEAHNNLGIALRALGRIGEAEGCFRQALALQPEYPEAHANLGGALQDLGRFDESEASYVRALQLRPDFPQAHNNLGTVLLNQSRLDEAKTCFARALSLQPGFAEAHNNHGNTAFHQGRPDQAVECYRRALELRPDYSVAHSNLLRTLHYLTEVTPRELAAAHAEFDRRHAAPQRATWRPHSNDRDPDRLLRIGLVSPDFGLHPVGHFLVRAAEALARRPCAIVYYSNRLLGDDLTDRFRAVATSWCDVANLTDAMLAEQVRADAIDVLIDLAGHTAGNRLLVFAQRPAPVQVTWLGYVGTTGLEAMDYLIADEWLVPPGFEAHHRERVLRLPGGHAGYDPPTGAPDPGPPPALAKGHVTFGCFNNPAKLSPPALAAFAAVLNRVPRSRLVLKYGGLDEPTVAGRLRETFAAAGVAPERVELRGRSERLEHLAAYRDIDIALDPFPYAGVMTTCEALWMGVPVVTLPGPTFASRHGLGLLSVVGLAELAARDVEDYAALAVELAHDLERLGELRATLRERVAHSTLCDGERLADELLAALRVAWREWASGGAQ